MLCCRHADLRAKRMTKNKIYAVKKGLRPGIYYTWADCQKQTQGVSGAVFKSFTTQHAADQFVGNETETVLPHKPGSDSSAQVQQSCTAAEDAKQGTGIRGELPTDSADQDSDSRGLPSALQPCAKGADLPAWMRPEATYRLVRLPAVVIRKSASLQQSAPFRATAMV